jgi:hypothetical protein
MHVFPDTAHMLGFMGLTPGSCWTYKSGMLGVYVTTSVSPADSNVIAGRTVYKESTLPAAGGLPTDRYFDATSAGKLLLARFDDGSMQSTRVSRLYDMDPLPLFGLFDFDSSNTVIFKGTTFDTKSTPDVAMGSGARMPGTQEDHRWVVISTSAMTPIDDGSQKPSIELSYSVTGQTQSATYWLVPNYGVAQYLDFDGTMYQVCAARICDASGMNCTGAAACGACP